MKRKTKAILLLTGIMVGCVIIGGLVGVASETSWDHALGRDKTAGQEATIQMSMVSAISNQVVDGNDISRRGVFSQESSSLAGDYSFLLEIDGTDDFDASTEGKLNTSWYNVNSVELTIYGYTGYIDEIELVANGTIKDESFVKVYVDGKYFGKEYLTASSDTYTFDYPWLVKGDIKLVFEQKDVENGILFNSITINPGE